MRGGGHSTVAVLLCAGLSPVLKFPNSWLLCRLSSVPLSPRLSRASLEQVQRLFAKVHDDMNRRGNLHLYEPACLG